MHLCSGSASAITDVAKTTAFAVQFLLTFLFNQQPLGQFGYEKRWFMPKAQNILSLLSDTFYYRLLFVMILFFFFSSLILPFISPKTK